MLIGNIYIKDTHLILRDVDGSEESMPLSDALELLDWLQQHKSEIEAHMQERPSIANINTSKGDTAIDEWLARQNEEEEDEPEISDGSGLHQCPYCYNLVNDEHEEFCSLNPGRNRNIVP